jgi:diazepam-binding inhibitor (GABA receptor modulating acyl-CoA-binding protein)
MQRGPGFNMPLQEDFQSAVDRSKKFTRRPTNEELLDLYALFKQGTDGDVTGERPGGFDFKAIAKFDAWTSRKGKTRDNAMREYVALVDRLAKEYNP